MAGVRGLQFWNCLFIWLCDIFWLDLLGGLESVRIGKCQNPFFAHFGRNWKVTELESVRIGKCQNWKGSELESVRIGKFQNWKVSESESVRIGKCQNQKASELESVRIFRFLKYVANDAYVTIVMQTMA